MLLPVNPPAGVVGCKLIGCAAGWSVSDKYYKY